MSVWLWGILVGIPCTFISFPGTMLRGMATVWRSGAPLPVGTSATSLAARAIGWWWRMLSLLSYVSSTALPWPKICQEQKHTGKDIHRGKNIYNCAKGIRGIQTMQAGHYCIIILPNKAVTEKERDCSAYYTKNRPHAYMLLILQPSNKADFLTTWKCTQKLWFQQDSLFLWCIQGWIILW